MRSELGRSRVRIRKVALSQTPRYRCPSPSLLELVREPGRHKVDGAVGRRLFQKFTGEEVKIDSGNAQMQARSPLQLRTVVPTDVACPRAAAGPQQVARYAVNAVVRTLPPEEICIRSEADVF